MQTDGIKSAANNLRMPCPWRSRHSLGGCPYGRMSDTRATKGALERNIRLTPKYYKIHAINSDSSLHPGANSPVLYVQATITRSSAVHRVGRPYRLYLIEGLQHPTSECIRSRKKAISQSDCSHIGYTL